MKRSQIEILCKVLSDGQSHFLKGFIYSCL